MAVGFRSSTTAASTGSTNFTISVPAGVANGDYLVLAIISYNLQAPNPAPPTGWTNLGAGQGTINSGGVAIYGRVASSEPGSYTITMGVTADSIGIMAAYSGPDAVTPFDAVANGTDVTSDTSNVHPGITTTHANEMLVHAVYYKNNGSFTPPAGFTTRASVVASTPTKTIVLCDKTQVAAGASGTITSTLGTAANSFSTIIAINPTLTTPQFWTDFIKCVEVDS